MSLEKMSYETATGTVNYRSKRHAGLKRNFQVMPGAEWPAQCPRALNQRQTVVIGRTREKRRIEFPIVFH